jgi:4a-hydroxytetrahydrobiopterin dehydratase
MRTVMTRHQLLAQRCSPLEGGTGYLDSEIEAQLFELPGWSLNDRAIERSYAFGDYHDTIAFINALAWMIHSEDHHPDLRVGFNRCTVRWNTHSVDGISLNDFICAAKSDAVFGRSFR